jgi:hypothetical protein
MYADPIVDEIHRFREQLLAQHHGDFSAYFAALTQAQRLHPERYKSFAPQSTPPSAQATPIRPSPSK